MKAIQNIELSDDQKSEAVWTQVIGHWHDGSVVNFKLWTDVAIYYGFLYVVSVVGILTHHNDRLHRFMHIRYNDATTCILEGACLGGVFGLGLGLTIGYTESTAMLGLAIGLPVGLVLGGLRGAWGGWKGTSMGELGVLTLFLVLVCLWIHFWQSMHLYEYTKAKTMSTTELWARTLGQLASLFIALLSLPTPRSSVWSMLFGVSWEVGIRFHRVLGYLTLVTSLLHQVLWWVTYAKESDPACSGQAPQWPHDIFAVPLCYHKDDWGVPAMIFVWFFMLVGMGIFAHEYFRRNHFELFYYVHHLYMVIYIAVLLHAPSLWYYLLGGLSLWILDRVVRFKRGCRQVQVACMEYRAPGVTRLQLQFGKAGFRYEAGQYCFLNVPEISATQWHPFSITSCPTDSPDTIEFNIKDMGEGTFTSELGAIALQGLVEGLTVSVDGPYGTPPENCRYSRIVCVAGGIGITPSHSLYRGLLRRDGFEASRQQLHLVWVCQNLEMLAAVPTVEATLAEVHERGFHTLDRRSASFSLILTRHQADAEASRTTTRIGLPFEPIPSARIDLQKEIRGELSLAGEEGGPGRTLVWACGPAGLVAKAQEAAVELGADFH